MTGLRWSVMRCALASAVVITVGVGAAAFRLSFATLRDLAVLARVPASDAWLFPVIVDGTILLATAGVLVLAGYPQRRFFLAVLIADVGVSIAGNSIHAIANGHLLPGWVAAIIAGVAPVSLVVDTHGLAILIRVAASRTRESDSAEVEIDAASDRVSDLDNSSLIVSEKGEPIADDSVPVVYSPHSSRPAPALLPVAMSVPL